MNIHNSYLLNQNRFLFLHLNLKWPPQTSCLGLQFCIWVAFKHPQPFWSWPVSLQRAQRLKNSAFHGVWADEKRNGNVRRSEMHIKDSLTGTPVTHHGRMFFHKPDLWEWRAFPAGAPSSQAAGAHRSPAALHWRKQCQQYSLLKKTNEKNKLIPFHLIPLTYITNSEPNKVSGIDISSDGGHRSAAHTRNS